MLLFAWRQNVYIRLFQETMLKEALPTHYVCAGMGL